MALTVQFTMVQNIILWELENKREWKERVAQRRNPDLEKMSKMENTERKTFNCSHQGQGKLKRDPVL